MWRLACLLWAKHEFKCIIGLSKDEACADRLRTSITDEIIEAAKKNFLNNQRIFIREAADDVGISFRSCQAFLRMF